MYIHLEIMVVKLARRLSDNPAGVGGQRHPIVLLADEPTVVDWISLPQPELHLRTWECTHTRSRLHRIASIASRKIRTG